jgi:hypothetical protein
MFYFCFHGFESAMNYGIPPLLFQISVKLPDVGLFTTIALRRNKLSHEVRPIIIH